MTRSVRLQYVNVGAAATATVVALGLVSLPPERHASAIARTEVAAVQLQAAVSTQIATLVHASAASTPSAAETTAPANPQASATGDTDALTAIATAAIAIAAAPLWYLAFPVTLPLSVIGGIALLNFLDGLPLGFGGGGQGNPITLSLIGALLGLGAFVVGPPALAISAVSSLFNAPATPAAAALPSARSAVGPAAAPDSNTVEEPTDAAGASVTPAVASAPDSPPTADTVRAAANAAATSGDDPLSSIARAALNVVGTLLSPIWFLAFPITLPFAAQLYHQRNPVYNPIAFVNVWGTLTTWTQFPANLGSYLFPSSSDTATAAATTRATASAVDTALAAMPEGATAAEADAETQQFDSGIPGASSQSVGSPARGERGADQRFGATLAPAASESDSTTQPASATSGASETTTTSAASDALALSDIVSGQASVTAGDDTKESALTVTTGPSAGPTRSTGRAPSAPGADNTATSARAGRAAHN